VISLDAKVELGLAADDYAAQLTPEVASYLVARGISKEAAVAHKIGYVGVPRVGHERYVGRVTIPYITPTCVNEIRFRALGEFDGPKYLSRDGADTHLYNVKAFEVESSFIAIAEGEFDAVIANSVCGIPTVGLAGANAWKPFYRRAFTDYHKIFVLADGDQAGADLGKKIATALDVAVVVSMPDGMDVTDVYLQEGPEGLRGRLGLDV